MNNYVCYHLHDWYSMLDSCTNPKDYINYAAELDQKAIGFSNHGNVFNWTDKKSYAESKGLKYLHGVEIYLTERFKDKNNPSDKNLRDNYHTILIAKNEDGMKEMHKLVNLSSREDHRYYKWRLSFEEFLEISDNIIKISACVQSPLNKFRLNAKKGGITEADKRMLEQLLKHYDYYEIQAHPFSEQIEYNKYLYKMSKRFNKPLIAATDTHNLNQYKAECRTMLQYGKTDGAWGDEENACDLTYKSYDELVEMFRKQESLPMNVVLEAIENTNVMADSIEDIKLDTSDKYPYLYGDKDEEVFKKVITDNYKDKLKRGIITNDKQYKINIKEEMAVFKKINMVGFMLFMSELMTWAKDNNIATGFARGSVAGSTIAYITNVTDVDPVKWHTVFSRFANEHRIEAGDIDTDWYEDDRQKVYDHIIERFGTEKTAYVLALGTLADKSVIDTIGKAFRVKAEKENKTTQYTLDKIKEIKEEYDNNPEETKSKYSDLFYYYDGLVDCIISQSQHPAGIAVSPINLIETYNSFYGADNQLILSLDMDAAHHQGTIKYDILGLKSVGVIDKTYKMIGKQFPRANEVDWNDQEVYTDIAEDNTAIFQFESSYSGTCLKKFKPTSIEDLSLVNAFIRPSGETYRDELLARHFHHNPSAMIDKMLEKNLGWLVYQEDTLAFLQQICGLSGSDADTIRRAIGHKDKEVIAKAMPQILEGYCAKSDKPRDIAEKEAKEFLAVIESSASYQFGFNHSLSYSLLSYLMGYLRHYYPTQFCTAFLNCAKNDEDIQNGTALALSRGCEIVEPTFGHSSIEFTCEPDNKIIYKGLSSIKNISDSIGDKIDELQKDEYSDFIELLVRAKKLKLNKTQMDVLIKLNYFNPFGKIGQLLYDKEIFDEYYKELEDGKQAQIKYEKWPYDMKILKSNAAKLTEKMAKLNDTLPLIRAIIENTKAPKFSLKKQLEAQNEFLGYLTLTLPYLDESNYYVSDRQITKHGKGRTIRMKLYRLKTGETFEVKDRAKKQSIPEIGDFICAELYKDRKYIPTGKEDEKGNMTFSRSDEKEWIFDSYKFLGKKGR